MFKACDVPLDTERGFAGEKIRAIVTLLVLEPGVVPSFNTQLHRNGGTKRKCRVPSALVLGIEVKPREEKNLKYKTPEWMRKYRHRLKSPVRRARSPHDHSFFYEVGRIVRPRKEFDPTLGVECTSGIHVFRTRDEAMRW